MLGDRCCVRRAMIDGSMCLHECNRDITSPSALHFGFISVLSSVNPHVSSYRKAPNPVIKELCPNNEANRMAYNVPPGQVRPRFLVDSVQRMRPTERGSLTVRFVSSLRTVTPGSSPVRLACGACSYGAMHLLGRGIRVVIKSWVSALPPTFMRIYSKRIFRLRPSALYRKKIA